jgi:hypothetical protein
MDVADAGVLGILGISKDKKCVKYDIPSMEVDYAIKGEDLFEYEFKREDLSNPNSLKLYVLAGAVPSDYEEMAEVGSSPDLSSKDPNFRYPEI